jgi:hypothetical protein
MAKRALLVAVSDYQRYAPTLIAPRLEVPVWRRLLASYGFTDIRPLVDACAKRTDVLKAIQRLIRGAKKNDQLVLVFMGHGRVVRAHKAGPQPYEEALLMYPDGDKTLQSAEITDSDIADILQRNPLPKDVDATIVLECCYGGYFDIPIPPGATPLFVPNPAIERRMSLRDVREFGAFARDRGSALDERAESDSPIIVAACGRDQLAFQIPTGANTARMLFTWKATDYLTRLPNSTYDTVVKKIYPLHPGYESQVPENRGNRGKINEIFPGEAVGVAPPPAPAPIKTASLDRGSGSTVALTEDTNGIETETTATSGTIDVDFEGICCLADHRLVTDPYEKRALFPFDRRIDPNVRHFAYVEIRADDVLSDNPEAKRYRRNSVDYLGWEPRGHRLDFLYQDESRPLAVTDSFKRRVPKITKIYPEFATSQFHPQRECFDDEPSLMVLDAYFDLVHGELSAGDPDSFQTNFQKNDGTNTLQIVACRNTSLRLWLIGSQAQLVLTPYADTAEEYRIDIKFGARVRVGSVREGDLRPNGTAETAKDHFRLYYDLSDPEPPEGDRAYPGDPSVPVNFCSQTTWP